MWWLCWVVACPAVVAAAVAASALLLGALSSADIGGSWMGLLSLAVPYTIVFALFGSATFVAMRFGAPHRLWAVPALGLVISAAASAIWVSRPNIDLSMPESYFAVIVSALLAFAMFGAIAGEVVFLRPASRRAHGEQAVPADSPKVD